MKEKEFLIISSRLQARVQFKKIYGRNAAERLTSVTDSDDIKTESAF